MIAVRVRVNVAGEENRPGREDGMRLAGVCVVLLILLTALGRIAPASAQPATPPTWPHAITAGGASVTVYQPQAISWPDQKTL